MFKQDARSSRKYFTVTG